VSANCALLAAFLTAGLATPSTLLASQCAKPMATPLNLPGTGELDIDSSSIDAGAISQAIAEWGSCPQYGKGFPTLVPNGRAGYPVSVTLIGGRSSYTGGPCGITQFNYRAGKLVGVAVTLWTQQGKDL
jgi:hypothetical protein